jgi:hypothetical protein
MKLNWRTVPYKLSGYVLMLMDFAVLVEGLDLFRLGSVATGGRRLPSHNFFFAKRI